MQLGVVNLDFDTCVNNPRPTSLRYFTETLRRHVGAEGFQSNFAADMSRGRLALATPGTP
jgi:hypothetical protein